MMKWQTALTTNPSIARAVGMLLDIVDNCDFQMDGAPMDDGKHVIALVKAEDDITIPIQIRYNTKGG